MKNIPKILLIVIGIMFFSISNASAEDRSNIVSLNPLGQYYVFGPMFEYERLINKFHGLSIGYSAISNTTPFNFQPTVSVYDYAGYLKGNDIELTRIPPESPLIYQWG